MSFARASTLDPTVLPPSEALLMATGGETLKVGNPADLILVRLDHSRVVPVQDYDSALVLGTHSSDVETVVVGGKILMKNKQVIVMDETILIEECRNAIKQLRKRTGLE